MLAKVITEEVSSTKVEVITLEGILHGARKDGLDTDTMEGGKLICNELRRARRHMRWLLASGAYIMDGFEPDDEGLFGPGSEQWMRAPKTIKQFCKLYRFKTMLGGDVSVKELLMSSLGSRSAHLQRKRTTLILRRRTIPGRP